ncbi:MAG: carboxypeptidase-like regulatory domain-containing protein [Caldilineales bacterium]
MTTSLKRLLLWLSGAPEEHVATAEGDQSTQAAPPPPTPAGPAVEFLAATPEPVPVAALPANDTLLDTREVHVPAEPINDATAYGVEIVPVDVPVGTTYWRAIRVHHLTPAENHGNHHIFLDALDEAGNRIMGAKARVTWPAGEQTITVDKPPSEPGANFPMWKWQICAVEMLDLPSDQVVNMHTGHPDEPPGTGNTLFHHSFQVDFQRAVKAPSDTGSVISGTVTNGGGHRVLLTLDGEIVARSDVDAAGGYRFENVPAGEYVLVVEGAGVYSDPVTVDGEQPVVVNLEVPPPLQEGKVMDRYVLFGAPGSPRTAVYLSQARPALLSYQPTFGFDPAEAAYAQNVVVVGGLQDVSQTAEDSLIAAGSRVERIQGSPAQIAAGLERILNPGGPV